jgi:hypothetical protein
LLEQGICLSIPVLSPKHLVLFLGLVSLSSTGVFAQSTEPGAPPSDVRLHVGPLFVNPKLGLTNIGVDHNVFNVPDNANPQSDFTMTLTPAADTWLRFGSSWIDTTVREDLVYYQEFASERSVNTDVRLKWVIPLNRLVLTPGGAYLNTHDRPGFEIDTRARRVEWDYYGTAELRVASKSFVGARFDSRQTRYDENAEFNGSNLSQELNRTVTTFGGTFRYEATPLTNIVVDVSREQDRFQFTPERDTDSTLITGGFRFDPAALLKGSATVGYRDFKPLASDVPGYQGFTAAVDLAYIPLESTRLTVTFSRDVQYSYDVNQPYYLQTGVTGSISQQIFGPVDLVARGGRQRLDYRDRAGANVAVTNRTDYVTSYGGGVGYHLGRDLRIGFNVDQQLRDSLVESNDYTGLRYGFAVNYGF